LRGGIEPADAVEVWPLKEARDGRVRHTVRPARRRPVEDYLRMQGRYRHLFEPERNAEAIARLQADVDRYGAAADAEPDTRASVTG
jgi:pyruvate ferredoxin oxidoreductase beta subunit